MGAECFMALVVRRPNVEETFIILCFSGFDKNLSACFCFYASYMQHLQQHLASITQPAKGSACI